MATDAQSARRPTSGLQAARSPRLRSALIGCDGLSLAIESWQSISPMAAASHRNFHVPLSTETYRALRSEADRRRRAATALVREAVEDWLERRRTEKLHTDIAEYAARHAGTPADLDEALEAAGMDALVGKSGKAGRTGRKAAVP